MINALAFDAGGEADRESDGFINGLSVATVTDNEDPDGLARVRVRLLWQPDDQQSYWARLAVPMAMDNQGVYFLPEVGDEVVVGSDRGDPSHLFVLGSLWNGNRKPPESNQDGKNNPRLIRTRSDSELRFFDGDQPSIELKLKDGKHLLMDDSGIKLEDGSGNTLQIETRSGAITIKSSSELKLQSPRISIQADGTMELKASGTLTIQGAMVQIN